MIFINFGGLTMSPAMSEASSDTFDLATEWLEGISYQGAVSGKQKGSSGGLDK